MCPKSTEQNLSEIDLKQHHPFLAFYLSAAAFSAALVLTNTENAAMTNVKMRIASCQGECRRCGVSPVCSISPMSVKRRTNYQALRFGFTATLLVSLLGGFVQGFGVSLVSWGGMLALQLISWSVGLILFSWRYR
jgi:hypothetical protein